MANSIDPDQMQHSVASDLYIHGLLKPVCLNTLGKYTDSLLLAKIRRKAPYLNISRNIQRR